MDRIKVLLVEDHMMMREGLRTLLASEADIDVVGEAQNGRDAVPMVKKLQPDVVIMDIAMPELNGFAATSRICRAFPKTKVLILSAYSDDAYIERVSQMGALGYVSKQNSAQLLASAIREVSKGNNYFSPAISKRLENLSRKTQDSHSVSSGTNNRLSARELEVLQLIAEGHANKQIAGDLGISIKTVEKHRQHVMEKLNIHDTSGLTRYAISAGIIESSVQIKEDWLYIKERGNQAYPI